MNTAFVCIMGIATVFIGLICLIGITKIMSLVCSYVSKNVPVTEPKPAKASSDTAIANKSEILAGVCAAIAEEIGTDVSNIKVTSFKKL